MPSAEAGGPTRATCAGCGCCCDDVELRLHADGIERIVTPCPLAEAWFGQRTTVSAPVARIEGAEAELAAAVEVAAELLSKARMPLVYGLGQTSCEVQREAVTIADMIGAVVDPAGGILDGSAASAFQTLGASTATLGEIRDRADVVVVWRADPATRQPRLLSRLRLNAPDRIARGSGELIVVDAERTATAERADTFIDLPAELDLEALWALRALARAVPLGDDHAPELPLAALEALAGRLRGCGHVAFLYDVGLVGGDDGQVRALALNALIRDLAERVHAVSVHLRREGNAAGAEAVLSWQTGYPASVSFGRGSPLANAGEFSATALLAGGDVDAALIVASDPLSHLPPGAAAALRELPIVTVDACETATTALARVAFTTAAVGIHSPGTTLRLDGVPVTLRAVLSASRPHQQQVLSALRVRLAGRRSGPSALEGEGR